MQYAKLLSRLLSFVVSRQTRRMPHSFWAITPPRHRSSLDDDRAAACQLPLCTHAYYYSAQLPYVAQHTGPAVTIHLTVPHFTTLSTTVSLIFHARHYAPRMPPVHDAPYLRGHHVVTASIAEVTADTQIKDVYRHFTMSLRAVSAD
jgi:hypothetical protein